MADEVQFASRDPGGRFIDLWDAEPQKDLDGTFEGECWVGRVPVGLADNAPGPGEAKPVHHISPLRICETAADELYALRMQNAELLEKLASMRHLAHALAIAWLNATDPNQWSVDDALTCERFLEGLGYFDGMPGTDVTPSALLPLLENGPDLQLLERAGRGGILADALGAELQALQGYPIHLMPTEQINCLAAATRTAAYALHASGIMETPTDADEFDLATRPVSEVIPLPRVEGTR